MRVPRLSLDWALLAGLWILMIALRQAPWFSREPRLAFGVLPAELAYQAGYSLLAAVVLALLVRFAWPAHLERASDSRDD